jgi:hypothetical protein
MTLRDALLIAVKGWLFTLGVLAFSWILSHLI